MLNAARQTTTDARANVLAEVVDALQVPAKPVALLQAEAAFRTAQAALTAADAAYMQRARQVDASGRAVSISPSEAKGLTAAIEAARVAATHAAEARAVARAKYGAAFNAALATPVMRAKALIVDIVVDLDEIASALVDCDHAARTNDISPLRAISAAPSVLERVRQIRALIGKAIG